MDVEEVKVGLTGDGGRRTALNVGGFVVDEVGSVRDCVLGVGERKYGGVRAEILTRRTPNK